MTLRYIKKCGDSWIACTAQGRKGELGLDQSSGSGRKTIYQYVFYGSLRIVEPFSDSSKTLELTKGKLFDVKELLGKTTVYEFLEDTHIFGFAPGTTTNEDGNRGEDSTIDWNGKLIEKNGEIAVAKKSILVCLDGSPIVNGKKLARYDYDELSTTKTYAIDLETDGVLALFTQI